MSLENLKPASKADAMVYVPYFQGQKRQLLPLAIGLYQQGSLEGERQIEGSDNIPFVATWFVSKLPSELTRCRLQFDGNAELSYEVDLQNSEFVDHLMDVIMTYKRTNHTDFSRQFYRKLLQKDDASS
ncbi:type IV pilus biogenesis protein EbsA [Spirulina subsalsa]|uniref:type IV pilus biogenesis protein EbsA n=1 Tax=Spirulina subsalsa TaxID=54311 RepID=UPI0002DC90BC|nr:type IV pilus biogenesis protein EbsA [Spirulina subsalsa]